MGRRLPGISVVLLPLYFPDPLGSLRKGFPFTFSDPMKIVKIIQVYRGASEWMLTGLIQPENWFHHITLRHLL